MDSTGHLGYILFYQGFFCCLGCTELAGLFQQDFEEESMEHEARVVYPL